MKNIVVMGGGTGTFTVLSGLKDYKDLHLTAIVSSADDGGSNKKFRDEFGLLPPSDFRQCLVALASNEDAEQTIRKLMMYRFTKGVGLEGQTFGNILIAALTDIEGSQIKAFEEVGKILKIKGEIYPITLGNVRLMAEYENGDITYGEHLIDEPEDIHDSTQRIKRLFLNRNAEVFEKAKEAIENADYIVLGPGDLYTSTLANAIVGNAAEIMKNSKAKIIYIVNLMTKYGQTFGFTAKDHVEEIEKYIGKKPDFIMINNTTFDDDVLEKYEHLHDFPVKNDLDEKKYKVISCDLVAHEVVEKQKGDNLRRSLIRHDSDKLAEVINQIAEGKF